MKRLYPLILYIGCFLSNAAGSYTPSSIPNPHLSGSRSYTANPDGLLRQETGRSLDSLAATIERQAEVQTAIVAISQMGHGWEAADFAQELFNRWGIGRQGRNTGVLILLVSDSRDIRIHTGGGLEGILTDAICTDILHEEMIPLLSKGLWDEGMLAGLKAVQRGVTTDSALQELLLDYHPAHSLWPSLLSTYLTIAFLLLIAFACFAYRLLNRLPASPNNIRYAQALPILAPLQICAWLFPLPVALFLWWYKSVLKRIRLHTIACPSCGHSMHRLSEAEEDAYLSDAEQAEENVHSVDYDVWLCPDCHNHIIFPYVAQRTSYQRCPHCAAITYALQNDIILTRATEYSNGKGKRLYRCTHCGHTKEETYVIPRLPIVIAGGGGNGNRGGGFGGGVSFGGGAGGKF